MEQVAYAVHSEPCDEDEIDNKYDKDAVKDNESDGHDDGDDNENLD